MLTKTTETAIQILVFLGRYDEKEPVSPREFAERLQSSPTYTAKITGMLVKANILRAVRGAKGGVVLAQEPQNITLLAVVEACQGRILADYCDGIAPIHLTCAYHQAMKEAHDAILNVFAKWTLADLLKKPGPSDEIRSKVNCRMGLVCSGTYKLL